MPYEGVDRSVNGQPAAVASIQVRPIGSSDRCACDHRGLIDIAEAMSLIKAHVYPVVGCETVPLAEATGRVLAEDVLNRTALPGFDRSAMDGYAVPMSVFSGSGPWRVPVVARCAAGHSSARLRDGSAARIFTGAQIPLGAEAVIPQELVDRSGDEIVVQDRPTHWANIRRAGEEMASGALVASAGTRIGFREVAALAACGATDVRVRRKLNISIIATGEELASSAAYPNAASIPDVNTPMLTALLAERRDVEVRTQHIGDDREVMTAALNAVAMDIDLIITTGGLSVGEEDHVRPALRSLDLDEWFSGVALKPGKPVSAGRLGGALWLGLPGNPLAALLTWRLFGEVILDRLSPASGGSDSEARAALASDIRKKPGRTELRLVTLSPATMSPTKTATYLPTSSAHVARLPEADGFVVLPASNDLCAAGELVSFHPFQRGEIA